MQKTDFKYVHIYRQRHRIAHKHPKHQFTIQNTPKTPKSFFEHSHFFKHPCFLKTRHSFETTLFAYLYGPPLAGLNSSIYIYMYICIYIYIYVYASHLCAIISWRHKSLDPPRRGHVTVGLVARLVPQSTATAPYRQPNSMFHVPYS